MAGPYPETAGLLRRLLQKGDKGEVRSEFLPLKYTPGGGWFGMGWERAVPDMARRAGIGLLDLLSAPSTGEITQEAGEFMLNMTPAGGLSAAVRPSAAGSLGIFGGRLAKTADTGALQRAEQMAAQGADRGQIWNDTGWFQGTDGKWRFDIDDSQAQLGRPAGDRTIYDTAGAVIRHPDLWEAYPELRSIDTALQKSDQGSFYRPHQDRSAEGLFDIQEEIAVRGKTPDEQRSAMLHELTHPIQEREGFAMGGSPSAIDPIYPSVDVVDWGKLSPLLEQYGIAGREMGFTSREALNNIWDEARRKGASTDDLLPVQEEMLRTDTLGVSPFDQYKRLAGETEARNVQARRDMTPDQRRATPPWETQDVPDEQQIVRFGTGGPSLLDALTNPRSRKQDRLN